MEARQLKARQIVAAGKITRGDDCFYVPSQQPGVGRYRVVIDGLFPCCNCPDFELTGLPCKHLIAAREWVASGEQVPNPSAPVEPTPPRKSYPQDWPNYNRAQTTEKDWFLSLLADLCRPIPEPERKNLRGRPIPLADGVFAAVYKVYAGFSARRFTCDLDDARERGHISGRTPHFNSVLNVFDNDTVTPILVDMIQRSAAPLAEVESQFATDSSGFASTRYTRWIDIKYGTPRAEHDWVKVHITTGVNTNCVTAAEIHDKNTNDCNILPSLTDTTAKRFTIKEMSADKAYAANPNFDAVARNGGTLYAAFRKNTTGGVGGLFEKMFHLFCLNREDYLRHYHRRSNVESTFSAIKRKFGDSVRSKTDTASKNEVYAKLICQNICCLIHAMYELGIAPTFPGDSPDDAPRDVIPFRPAQQTINLHNRGG